VQQCTKGVTVSLTINSLHNHCWVCC